MVKDIGIKVMNKHQIKVNDEVVAEIPGNNRMWEIKLYIESKDGRHEIKAVTTHALPRYEKITKEHLVMIRNVDKI